MDRDAARALADWAFASLALETIFIDREPRNLTSGRVAERLGATLAGRCDLRGSRHLDHQKARVLFLGPS